MIDYFSINIFCLIYYIITIYNNIKFYLKGFTLLNQILARIVLYKCRVYAKIFQRKDIALVYICVT